MYDKAEKVVKNLSSMIFDLRSENESLYDTVKQYSKIIDELKEENDKLKNIRDEAISYNKELCKIYDCGMELSNAQTNLCILEDTETLNILKGDNNE